MRPTDLFLISMALVSMGWGNAAGEPLRRGLAQERDFPARSFPRKEPAHGVIPKAHQPRETAGLGTPAEVANLDELKRLLHARGFSDIADIRRMGDHFVVRAKGRGGQDLTLVVDVRTNEISGLRVRGR